MEIKSGLRKLSEIATLLFYVETTPLWRPIGERRTQLINKYRHTLTENFYFKNFVEPLVLRLNEHATKSKNVKKYPCAYKGTTFVYTIRGHPIYPILTMGSKEQLYEICKKECVICPTAVYTPALIMGLIQLAMFETARSVSKIKGKINRITAGAKA